MPTCNVDLIALRLAEAARMAHAMPPSWDGGCVSQPLTGPEGQHIGWMLPGKGLYLRHDLKSVGITRGRIPHVYERTPIRRLAEALMRARHGAELLAEDERGAITSYDNIIANRAAGQGEDRMFLKTSITSVANSWSSLWLVGGQPAAGTYSATPGVVPNYTTTGALSYALTNPASGNKYLLNWGMFSTSALNFMLLVDLLAQVGSLSATSTSSQTVSSGALTRYSGASSVGNLFTFNITTALGSTASNITVTYTNQAGTGSRTTAATAMLASGIVSRLTPSTSSFMALQSGDTGVQSVQSVQLSASMGSGVFALDLYHPLNWIAGLPANTYIEQDSTIQFDSLVQLVVGSDSNIGCLGLYLNTNTTSTGTILGTMRTVYG